MKKVAILGFGLEGRAAWRYFKNQGADITIFSENQPNDVPEGVELRIGPQVFETAIGFDVVVRTPSIALSRIKTDGEITSVTKEFFKHCPATIIGVTGSKGKGTTATLIRDMLQQAGKKVYLVGNIGLPALEVLDDLQKDDFVVYELSSFQLWDLTQSPAIAVVLMIEPEHLDIHENLDDYLEAKGHISAYQQADNITIYLPDNQLTVRVAMRGAGKKQPYTQPPGAYVRQGYIVIDNQKIIATAQVGLVGQHNIENACAAVTAAWQITQDVSALRAALRNFTGLDHRLKLVATIEKVRYYDDSIATTPGSAIAALRAFTQPKIVILGGISKGADFTELAQEIASSNVKSVLLIGQERFKLQAQLQKVGFSAIELFDTTVTMQALVNHASHLANQGDVVILSPACTSFDMFKNYADRGDQFIAAVKNIVKNKYKRQTEL